MSDEPRIEIAPCPMPGCGGPVRIVPQRVHGLTYGHSAACVDCDYRFGRSLPTREEAIAAHNALCADVKKGREAAKIEQERDALRAENARLRATVEKYGEAIGLFSTVKPDMVMNADDPILMAQDVVAYVGALRAENARLRAALAQAERRCMEQTPHTPGRIVWACHLCGSLRGTPHDADCPFAALDAGQARPPKP